MKSQEFLKLVEKTLNAKQDYFAAKRKGLPKDEQIALLVRSKELEKQCRAVIAAGRLEPDEPVIERMNEEQQAEYYRLLNEHQLELQLDLSGSQRGRKGEME